MKPVQTRAIVATVLAAGLLIGAARPVRGQAWVPPQGEGTGSITFQDAFVRNPYYSDQVRTDVGHIRSRAMTMSVTYGLTSKVAITLSLPWVRSKYYGTKPHQDPALNPIDGGAYHGSFQDLRFDAAYNVSRRHIAVTPFIGGIVPSRDYQYFAHAAVGRHVTEIQIGANAGRVLGHVFVEGRYAFGFAERIQNIPHDRSMLDLEGGYFLGRSLRVCAAASGQVTHGGIDIPAVGAKTALGALFPYHDQLGRDNHVNVGGGVTWPLGESIDVFGSFMRTAVMRNGHGFSPSVSIGLSYTFLKSERARAVHAGDHEAMGNSCPMNDSKETSLAKCVCMKGC